VKDTIGQSLSNLDLEHPLLLEHRIIRRDGQVRDIVVRVAGEREQSGGLVAYGSNQDITDLKRTEQALVESEEKFRRIFDSANDGIIIVDVNPSGMPGRIRDVNAIHCTRLGYTRSELQKMNFLDIITPESRGKIPSLMVELLSKGHVIFESVFVTKDTSLQEAELSSHIIKFRERHILIAVARDISQRKKEVQTLRIVNQKLQLMNIVAWHDIQNKITGLRGYVELSKDYSMDDHAREFLIREEAVLKTIYDHIQYTKEYQEIGIRPMQWVNISQTIASVLSITDKKGMHISVDLADLFLYCDPVIEKVFAHLVENTVIHGQKATMIRMWYEESATGLTLFFVDDGIGIPADRKESVFVRDVAKGSGFSLYFIHDILELSGMGIRESGEPGMGVRFEISVPPGTYRIGSKP